MVTLTTKQVETFFGELEYIEGRLKMIGIVEVGGVMRFSTDEETNNILAV